MRPKLMQSLIKRFSTQSVATRHVLAALVVNQPGCLSQIANLFAARGYNIDSLVVGRTEVPELSRMTVVVNGTPESVWNMKKQMEDVVHVALVNILNGPHDENPCVERDLMLAKVSTTSAPDARRQVMELANLFDAQIVDVRPDQILLQLAGPPARIESLIELLRPLGVTEIHRSGVIAMSRGEDMDQRTFQGATTSIMNDDLNQVDDTHLPPG